MQVTNFNKFVRSIYETNEFVPLHAPSLDVSEQRYVADAIKSTFVSSAGPLVADFEIGVAELLRAHSVVATNSGTSALHLALKLCGVQEDDLVITQSVTFVATCNAINYCGAYPVFCDVDISNLGLCPTSVEYFLQNYCDVEGETCVYRPTGQRVKVLMPMHTFGHPAKLDKLAEIAMRWNLQLVEDAAESLGSMYKGQHTGTFGRFGCVSFNGNKVITTGAGGAVVCADDVDRAKARHLSTTAKINHPYEFIHDETGYNYRLPNLNAALGVAQLTKIEQILNYKRQLASAYGKYFEGTEYKFITEPPSSRSNYWLNAIGCPDKQSRDEFLEITNQNGIMTRPLWQLMHRLKMFSSALRVDLTNSEFLADHIVNIPSSPQLEGQFRAT